MRKTKILRRTLQIERVITLALMVFVILFVMPAYSKPRVTTGAQSKAKSEGPESGNISIDDFESPNSPAPWTYYNGDEFPGASGSLSSGAGHHGNGAHLAYNFANGGAYVSADYNLPALVTGAAVAFWVKTSGTSPIFLRVRDTTGQTLQYHFSRPLEAMDPNAWYQQIVELDAPTLYSGGANDGILHGGIAGISISASNLYAGSTLQQGLTGAIDFDEVIVIPSLRLDLEPFNTPLTPAPPGKSNLMSDLGVAIHFPMSPSYTVDTRALDAIRDAGFSWVRMDLFWSDVERTPGVYDFTSFDTLLAELDLRGLKALFILDYSNLLHSDCPPGHPFEYCFSYGPQSTATVRAFGDYAEAAARHYAGRGVRYEVWNEPNYQSFWNPAPSASQYATLAIETIARVHHGDPAALVTSGSLSLFDFRFLRSVLDFGGAAGTNAIGVHPYRQGAAEGAADELVGLRAMVAEALPPGTAVWNTEWGYSSQWFGGDGTTPAALNRQAVMAVREILSAQVLGFPLSIYYDIRDDGTDPANFEHHFGLLANDYSDKPAMAAVRTLKSVAANRVFAGSLSAQPTSLHALRLDATSNSVVVLWSDQPGGRVDVTLPAPATAIDMFGAPLSLPSSNGRVSLVVRETSGPVYVTISAQATGKLFNISTRLQIGTADRVMIAGFIVQGSSPKRVLIRAAGPSLANFGVPNALANPRLELHDASNTIGTNDDWQTTQIGGVITSDQAAEIQNSGLAPSNPGEASLIATLPPGSYTAIVEGVNGGTGVGIVEAYDLDETSGSRLANISTRGFVQTGDDAMIGGFIVVTQPTRVMIRTIGPSLTQFGVLDALANPQLELHDATSTLAQNNDWQTTQLGGIITSDQVAEIQNSQLAPTNPAESAIIATLQPGSYTAIVRGVNNITGNALVEVYALQ